MNISRRSFLGAAGAAGAAIALPGCCCCSCCGGKAQVALQLYSIRTYIGGKKDKSGKELVKGKGLAQALKDVAAIGYKGVEFAGYYGHKPEELKAMLADAGLVVCGTHVANNMYGFDTKAGTFNPDVLKKTCEFELAYGNSLIICPGGGNIPPGATWSTGRGGEPCKPSQAIDDFTKMLVELYNKAAEVAKKEGCKIGLHNHTWEHGVKMLNGMGKGVKKFDAILGKPGCDENGKLCATPVPWDELFPVTDADGVKWYVVECERHEDTFDAIKPSFDFLKSKGRA